MTEADDFVPLEITHNQAASRFETEVQGQRALLTYRLLGNTLFLDHTEVSAAIERRGIGSGLAHAALEYARSKGLRVVPVCPFVAGYLRKHPEYQDLLAPATRKRLLEQGPFIES